MKQPSKKILTAALMSSIAVSVMVGCSKDTPVTKNESVSGSYSFSGAVLDGSGVTNKAMSSVVVKFNDGKQTVLTCDDAGMFFINNIPYGKKNFIVASTDATTPYTMASYTAVVDTIRKAQVTPSQTNPGQITDKNTIIDTLVQDQSANIKLYPLTGAVKGSVYGLVTNHNDASLATDSLIVPLANVRIMAKFKDTENFNTSGGRVVSLPNRFDAKTDANGNFVITGLPIAPSGDIALQLSSVEVIGEDFEGDSTQLANVFASKDTTQLKRAILRSNATMNNNRDLIYVASSSILGSNKLPLDAVDKKAPITFTFTSAIKGVPTVTIPGNDFTTAVSADGLTLTLTPKTAGWVVNTAGAEIGNVNVFVSATLTTNNTPVRFLTKLKTAQIADGKDYIESSSILSGNGAPLKNVSPTAPVTVVFTQPLANVPSVTGSSVGANANDFSVALSADMKTLTLTPKTGMWKSDNLTINAELASGKDIAAITLALNVAEQITDGKRYLASSSVLTANGDSVLNVSNTAPITFTFTKKLAGVPAVSTSGGTVNAVKGSLSADSLTVTVSQKEAVWTATTVKLQGTFADGSDLLLSVSPAFEPAFGFVKSLPMNNAIDVNDTIKVIMNEQVVAQQAQLLQNGVVVPAKVTVSGDTILIDPQYKLTYGAVLTLNGRAENKDGESANLALVPSMTVAPAALFAVSNSLLDANGQPRTDINPYAPIVLVFNKPIHTDVTKFVWSTPAQGSLGASGTEVVSINGGVDPYTVAGAIAGVSSTTIQPNATVKVSGDTVTITPDNRMRFRYNAEYGFSLAVTAADGETQAAVSYKAATGVASDYLIYDNTIDPVTGQDKEFGRLEPVTFAVPSFLALKELTGATVSVDGGAPVNVSLSTIKLNAAGDTATYTPELPSSGLQSLIITGKLKNASGANTNTIETASWPPVEWRIVTDAVATGANNTANGAYRQLAATGDSLLVTFSKAIDPSKTIAVSWTDGIKTIATRTSVAADGKTVTVYPLDTLGLMPYGTKYNDMATAAKYTVSVTGTTVDGNGANSGSIKVLTQEELALVDASFRKVHDITKPMATALAGHKSADYDAVHPFANTAAISLTFNREVDAASLAKGLKYEVNHKVNGAWSWDSIAVTATLDATKKIATLVPATPLAAGQRFCVSFIGTDGVWAENIKNAGGAKIKGFTLDTVATQAAVLPTLTALKPVIARTKVGANTERLNYDGGPALKVDFSELAWNVNHDDSISAYEVEATTSSATGAKKVQVVDLADMSYSIFGTAARVGVTTANLTDLVRSVSLGGYSNGTRLFAAGDSITLKVRPKLKAVVGYKADGTTIEDSTYGTWSDALVYKDVKAPDEVFGTDTTTTTTVSSVDYLASDTLNASGQDPFNRNLALNVDLPAMIKRIEISFAEDMDVSVKPSNVVELVKGAAAAQQTQTAYHPTIDAQGTWKNARTYVVTMRFPMMPYAIANQDYTAGGVGGVAVGKFADMTNGDGVFASRGFGYSVKSVGFKDISGNTVAAFGTPGAINPATGNWDNTNFKQGSSQVARATNQ